MTAKAVKQQLVRVKDFMLPRGEPYCGGIVGQIMNSDRKLDNWTLRGRHAFSSMQAAVTAHSVPDMQLRLRARSASTRKQIAGVERTIGA